MSFIVSEQFADRPLPLHDVARQVFLVAGYADTSPFVLEYPRDPRNRRISIILLFPQKLKKAGQAALTTGYSDLFLLRAIMTTSCEYASVRAALCCGVGSGAAVRGAGLFA